MDNVLNRPLFRHREARNRLNDIAGVQRFAPGGFVTADPSGAITRQYSQRPIRPEGLPSIMDQQALRGSRAEPSFELITLPGGEGPAGEFLYDRVSGEVRLPDGSAITSPAIAETVSKKIQSFLAPGGGGTINSNLESGIAVLTEEATRLAKEGFPDASMDAADRALKLRGQLSALEQEQAAQGKPTAQDMGQSVFSVEGPESAPSQAEALDIFKQFINSDDYQSNVLERAAVDAVPPAPAPAASSVPGAASPDLSTDMGFEARRGRAAPVVPSAPADSGPTITDPAAVAAGLNSEDIEVREKTVTDFMKEYSDAAPKYEGVNKNLLLAQIGFAIAAGESPNAMQNIANGLLAGSDAMLKDKAAKDEFDRQVQLAAMQYGFGEKAQERALGRQFTNYVANDTVKYRGKTYKPGESVPVIHSDIINGRMPGGIVTEGTSDALIASDAVIRKSMSEALKAQKLEPAAYRAAIETLDTAASEYSSARNLMPLLEASLLRAANGEVTGLDSALTRKMNEVMNAVGLKPEASYESPEAFESALRQVSVTMVQDLLGESGKTISDADRKLIDGLIGLQQDIVSGVIKDPDILTRKVQELMRVLESKQQNALDVYSTAMEGYGGTYSPSGTPVRSLRAERTFNSEETVGPAVQYEWDQASGRLVRKKNEG